MARKVLLGVSGCIAAYKACEILRELQKKGCDVEVVMTENATRFVSAHTFSALSGKPALVDNFADGSDPIPHIRTASECDVFLIAPCTGNVLSKIAAGIADDLLTTCALAAHDKLMVAPAMNVHMYESPATQHNLDTLRSRGVKVIEPESGYLACGDTGKGRLAEVGQIVEEAIGLENARHREALPLSGHRVLVTAGPTVEWIDPVRYISNPSSGKMGFAVARAARDLGADVTLVCGPVSLDDPEGVDVVRVGTAQEMLEACESSFDGCSIAVFAAAVSDFRPKVRYDRKLKKSTDEALLATVDMVRNADVLHALASCKTPGQFVVGFAAETDDVVGNAREKLLSKGADLIVANQVGEGMGFQEDGNAAWLVSREGTVELPYMPKDELAAKIMEVACDNFKVC